MTYADIAGNRYPVVRMPDGNDWIASDLRYGQLAADKICISRDGGTTWDNASQLHTFISSTGIGYVYDSLRHRVIGISVGGTTRVMYSEDGGVSWFPTQPVGQPPNPWGWDLSLHGGMNTSSLIRYCYDSEHDSLIGPMCQRSLDGGTTWSFPTTAPDGFLVNDMITAYDYTGNRIVACGDHGYLATSTDGGDTYIPFLDPNTGWPVYSSGGITIEWRIADWSCICHDPYHNTVVILSHAGTLCRGMVIAGNQYKMLTEQGPYADGVGSLLVPELDRSWRSSCFDSLRNRIIAVGNSHISYSIGYAVYSDDGGYTWTSSSLNPITSSMWVSVVYDAEHDSVVARNRNNEIAVSIDGGASWSVQAALPGDGSYSPGLIYDEYNKVVIMCDNVNVIASPYKYQASEVQEVKDILVDGWAVPSESDVAGLASALSPKPALKLKDQYPDNTPTSWSPYPNAGTTEGTYSKDVYGFRAVPYSGNSVDWWTSEGTLFGITHSGDNITTKSAPNGQESPIRLMRSGTWTRPVAEAPSATPEPGTYYTPQDILLSSPSGFSIYYTTDGSAPSELSQLYISSVPVSATTIIKAISTRAGYDNSQVAAFGYTIQEEQPTQAFVIPSKPSVQFYNFYSKRFDVY